MWNSQDSGRRLSEPIDGIRGRSAAESSSAPPRLNFPAVTSPGLANRILGAELDEALPPAPLID